MDATSLALTVIQGAFAGKAWQGPTLSASLKGVTLSAALWKPSPIRRCVWEQLLHATYWKLTILRVFDPQTPLTMLRPGSNWPKPLVTRVIDPHASVVWREDVKHLHTVHQALMVAAATLNSKQWHTRPRMPGSKNRRSMTYAQYAAGAAAHDAYHCGQIRLLRRLYPA